MTRKRLIVALLLTGFSVWAAPQLWAWYHLRAALADLGRYHGDAALNHLRSCLRVWPSNSSVLLLASRAARQAGDLEEARQLLYACQRREGTPSAASTLEWALMRAAGGDLIEVDRFLEGRIDKDPASGPLIWEALAEGYIRTSRGLDAMASLNRWLDVQPDNVQALFLRGKMQRQMNGFHKAAADFRKVVEIDASRDDARWGMVVCLMETGRYEDALAQLEYLQARRPHDADIPTRIARCLSRLGREKEARQTLDAVIAERPDYGPALRTRGEMAQMNGDLEEAEKWFRRTIDVLPFDYAANIALYQVLHQQKKTAEAKQQLGKADELKKRYERLDEVTTRQITRRPNDPALHHELGMLLLGIGNNEAGERWLLSAAKLDPQFRPAQVALADYYRSQGDAEKAALFQQQANALPETRNANTITKP